MRLKGCVKRAEFAAQLRMDRKLAGRGVKSRRGRRPLAFRPTLTRAEARALWTRNRNWTAASLRADRRMR